MLNYAIKFNIKCLHFCIIGSGEEPPDASAHRTKETKMLAVYVAQNARLFVVCIECRKPRVLYMTQKPSDRQLCNIVRSVSEYDYTCGAPVLPSSHRMFEKVSIRPELQCALPVEFAYYSSQIGRVDICSYCAIEECVIDGRLKLKYRTVLPICAECKMDNDTIVMRPFGVGRSRSGE